MEGVEKQATGWNRTNVPHGGGGVLFTLDAKNCKYINYREEIGNKKDLFSIAGKKCYQQL